VVETREMSMKHCPHCGRDLPASNHHPKAWTSKELEIVKEVYPKGGPKAVQERIPHRTLMAIQAFASKHKIASRKRRRAKPTSDIRDGAPDFDAWCEDHGNDLWTEYEESGAHYDTDYGAWLEDRYVRLFEH
jgi:hypothetical protein